MTFLPVGAIRGDGGDTLRGDGGDTLSHLPFHPK